MLEGLRSWLSKPSKEWLDEAAKQPAHTPDYFKLQDRPCHLVFEYGDLQSYLPKNTSLLKLDPLYPVAFSSQKFSLWKVNQFHESFPVALPCRFDTKDIPRTKIRGEVFKIPYDRITALDNYRENGVKFLRKKVRIILPFNNIRSIMNNGKFSSCLPFNPIAYPMWMYVGCASYWKDHIDWDYNFYGRTGGRDFTLAQNVADQTRPWLKNYYYFTKEDYEQANRKPPTLSRVPQQRRLRVVR